MPWRMVSRAEKDGEFSFHPAVFFHQDGLEGNDAVEKLPVVGGYVFGLALQVVKTGIGIYIDGIPVSQILQIGSYIIELQGAFTHNVF